MIWTKMADLSVAKVLNKPVNPYLIPVLPRKAEFTKISGYNSLPKETIEEREARKSRLELRKQMLQEREATIILRYQTNGPQSTKLQKVGSNSPESSRKSLNVTAEKKKDTFNGLKSTSTSREVRKSEDKTISKKTGAIPFIDANMPLKVSISIKKEGVEAEKSDQLPAMNTEASIPSKKNHQMADNRKDGKAQNKQTQMPSYRNAEKERNASQKIKNPQTLSKTNQHSNKEQNNNINEKNKLNSDMKNQAVTIEKHPKKDAVEVKNESEKPVRSKSEPVKKATIHERPMDKPPHRVKITVPAETKITPKLDDKKTGARKGQPSPGERPPWNDSVFDTTAAARRRDKKPTAIESARARTANLAAPKDPLFYIGGNNGNALVETPLLELGWRKISSKYADNYKLRWVECKSAINYNAFKEGLQMVNRIPNCHLLTNKLGLLNSLQRYERVQTSINPSRQSKICSADFLPETYRLDDAIDRKTFFDTYRDNNSNDLWICKPCGMNQGKGIYIVRDLHDFEKTMEEREENLKKSHRPMERIIQRYIMHPMLLEDRKFDIRAYMLIASTVPYFVLYHKGYVRLCLYPYDAKEHSLTAHLTNQFIQKKDKDYNKNKESTVWSMDRFNEYFNKHIAEEKGVEKDWVYTVLTPRMKQIMHYCFNAVKHKLRCRHGYFDLYGLDFMVDQDLNVSLIEVNVNPCLSTNCEALKDVIPDVVREGLFIAIECFDKTKRNQSLLPLQSLKNYQIIYASSSTPRHPSSTARGSPTHAGSQSRPRSLSPLQARSRSLSPTKDTPSSSSPHRSLSPNHSSSRTRHSLSPTHSQTRNSLPKIETRKHREFLPLPPPPPPRSLSIMVPHSMNLTPASVGLESSSSSSSTSFPEASNEVRFKLTHNGSDNELPPPTFKPAVAQPKTSTTTSQQDSIVSTTTSYQVTSSATLQSPMVVSSPFKLAATVKKTNNSGNVGTSASLFKLNSPPPKDSSTPSKLLTASSSALVTSIPSALRFNRPKTPSRAPSPIDKLQLALNIAKKNERGS